MSIDTSFSDWLLENLRLSIFSPGRFNGEGLWSRVVGIQPESMETRPLPNNVYQEQGLAHGNRLVLAVQSGRHDWTIAPGPQQQSGPPVLTAVAESVSLLQKALTVSLGTVRQIDRLALGVTLLLGDSDTPSEAMRPLSRHLPDIIPSPSEGMSDFIYQINRRRRSSSVPHATINRVAKWSIEMVQQVQIPLGDLNAVPGSSSVLWVSKLLLDINTVPGGSAISNDRFPILFEEFVNLASEVARRGDI